jgi:hypothetical protein
MNFHTWIKVPIILKFTIHSVSLVTETPGGFKVRLDRGRSKGGTPLLFLVRPECEGILLSPTVLHRWRLNQQTHFIGIPAAAMANAQLRDHPD